MMRLGINLVTISVLGLIATGRVARGSELGSVTVRFGPGQVVFPEDTYDQSAPLEDVVFATDSLEAALRQVGVTELTLVCPAWRHLDGPQLDIHGNEMELVDFTDVYAIDWDDSISPEVIRGVVEDAPGVLSLDLYPVGRLAYPNPNDPLFADQWAVHNTGQTILEFDCTEDFDINALEAWDIQDTSLVNIGVSEGGFDKSHEDLEDATHPTLFYGPDDGQEDESCGSVSHGSAVAGIAGATGGNALGISGAASPSGGAILVPMRVTKDEKPCSDMNLAKVASSLSWACSVSIFPDVPIINHSWFYFDEQLGEHYGTLRNAFRNAYQKGLFLNVAAGNQKPFGAKEIYPAWWEDYTYAVGAVHCDGTRPAGYWKGHYIDAAAPGGNLGDGLHALIKTTWGSSETYTYFGEDGAPHFGGTSASSPHVSAIAALLWSKEPNLTNDDITQVLNLTALDLGSAGFDTDFGHGLVRADSALKFVSSPNEIIHGETTASRIDSIDAKTLEIMNVPCLTATPDTYEEFDVHFYEMVAYASFADSALAVWTRGRQTGGWRYISDQYDGLFYGNWAEVVPGTITALGCSLRAYTYRLFQNGQEKGWYPVNGATGRRECPSELSAAPMAYTYVVSTEGQIIPESPPRDLFSGGPTPFNPRYSFEIQTAERQSVGVAVFDVTGRRVRDLSRGLVGPGTVEFIWDGKDFGGRDSPSGVYLLRVDIAHDVLTRKIHLLR